MKKLRLRKGLAEENKRCRDFPKSGALGCDTNGGFVGSTHMHGREKSPRSVMGWRVEVVGK